LESLVGSRTLLRRQVRTSITTLFPYTTLFRSRQGQLALLQDQGPDFIVHEAAALAGHDSPAPAPAAEPAQLALPHLVMPAHHDRSEEHTSELQSRENLVCRLLLEKKNCISTQT